MRAKRPRPVVRLPGAEIPYGKTQANMSAAFEILDACATPLGELVLRRRQLLQLDDRDVFEVKLGAEFLMSSLFHEAEEALADRALTLLDAPALDVVVGGLGLGYTAAAALKHAAVRSLLVVDALEPVIEWHRRGLVPLGLALAGEPRCRLALGDFFALAERPEAGFDAGQPGRRFHAVLVDIDHSPDKVLHAGNRRFYREDGLRRLARHLHPGGVFALWSDDPPDPGFLAVLRQVFASAEAVVVPFANPLTGGTSANTIYLARSAAGASA